MAAITKTYFKGIVGGDKPDITAVFRDIADDLATLAGAKSGTVTALGALTSVQEATTNAVDLPTAEALANSLKLKYNALQIDVAAIATKVNAIITALTTDIGAVGGIKTTKV